MIGTAGSASSPTFYGPARFARLLAPHKTPAARWRVLPACAASACRTLAFLACLLGTTRTSLPTLSLAWLISGYREQGAQGRGHGVGQIDSLAQAALLRLAEGRTRHFCDWRKRHCCDWRGPCFCDWRYFCDSGGSRSSVPAVAEAQPVLLSSWPSWFLGEEWPSTLFGRNAALSF
jgi:hypothetical protein